MPWPRLPRFPAHHRGRRLLSRLAVDDGSRLAPGLGVRARALPFTVISADARRPLAASQSATSVMVSLDDLAALFQLTVREDALAGGVTVGYKGQDGHPDGGPGAGLGRRPPRVAARRRRCRDGRRWLVPVEFVSRALGLVYDARLDVRKNSRLVLVGDVRVPRVAVRAGAVGAQTRVTFAVAPRTPYTVTQETGRVLVRFDADALDVALPPLPAAGAAPVGPPRGVPAARSRSTSARGSARSARRSRPRTRAACR